jgi:hypothetical protein
LDNLVIFARKRYCLNKESIQCDLFDVLDGTSKIISIVSYIPGYDWSVDYEATIMDMREERLCKVQQ